MSSITYSLMALCLLLTGWLLFWTPSGDDATPSGGALGALPSSATTVIGNRTATMSDGGALYAAFGRKTLLEFAPEELLLFLQAQDRALLTDLAGKIIQGYTDYPAETIALLEQLAQDAITQGGCSSYLQLTSQVKVAPELNQIEFDVVQAWLQQDPQACLDDTHLSKQQGDLAHRLSLLTAVYMQDPSLQIDQLLAWGDELAEDRGTLAHKLSVHLTEDSRPAVNAYFQRNIDHGQVQASLIPLLLQTPPQLADSQMEWLASVDLSECNFSSQVVGALFTSIAQTNPQLLVDTLNNTDYLHSFLTPEQQSSSLADFHYQEFYDRVLHTYIQNIAQHEFENAQLALEHIVNPHIHQSSYDHLERLRPLYEQQQQLDLHRQAVSE